MRRLLTFGIVASWLAMAALLVHKQAPPELGEPLRLTGAVTERDEWFGVYQEGRKIGHAHRVTARTGDGYVFYEDSVVALAMLGVPQTLRTALTAETDADYALRRFSFTLLSPATTFTARGTTDGQRLAVRYGAAGHEADLALPLAEPIHLPSTLRPHVLAGDRQPGKRYTVPVFSPVTLRNEPLTLTVEGPERLERPAGAVDTIRLAEEFQGLRTHAWLDASGAVVREEAALGFTLEREPRDVALAGADARTPVDLVAASRIPLAGTITDPRDTTRLTLRLAGAAAGRVPHDPPRQRRTAGRLTIAREAVPTATLPLAGIDAAVAAYAAPSPFIESDDPAIVARARAIVGPTADAVVAARRLVAWVGEHVEKAPTVTVPSAREVLASGRGDCNEHAVLLAALARAVGIPARVVTGAVYANDGFYYHAWSELWLGQWVSADGVFGQLPADATHVKLLEGGLEQQLALAGVIGRLRLAVVEEGGR